MKNTDFGFALRSKHIAGQFRPFATFICKCGATLEEIVPAGPVNPEAVAKRARNKGWDCVPIRHPLPGLPLPQDIRR